MKRGCCRSRPTTRSGPRRRTPRRDTATLPSSTANARRTPAAHLEDVPWGATRSRGKVDRIPTETTAVVEEEATAVTITDAAGVPSARYARIRGTKLETAATASTKTTTTMTTPALLRTRHRPTPTTLLVTAAEKLLLCSSARKQISKHS